MGKGFCKDTKGLILILLFYVLLFSLTDIDASFSELELFDKAYENYISYRPEEAIKDFKTFLAEFTDSSAKDAAMFWLAKSLIQTKSFVEAKEIFSYMKKQFPESPFLPFVDEELEKIKKFHIETHKEPEISETAETNDAFKIRIEELKKKIEMQEKTLKEAMEERDKLKLHLEQERKNAEDLKAKIREYEKKEFKKE
jgi:hypothetical protein